MFNNYIVPITPEVSVDSRFIQILCNYVIPDIEEYGMIVDKLLDEAIEEEFRLDLTYKENKERTYIKYFQKMWNLLLEKGNEDYV